MRTHFSVEQLTEPELAEAEKSLRSCIHCGICTATCPTYLLLGDERDSPRGRIVMMQRMLEEGGAPSPETVHHLDRCLSCLGCRTACPSSVDYQRLIDASRAHIAKTYRRPARERLFRRFILDVLSRPERVRSGSALARLFSPIATRLPGRLGELAKKGARALPAPLRLPAPDVAMKRVALLPGCVQAALAPSIDAAAARVLARRGLALVPLPGAGCCGALAHHLGEADQARAWAKRIIESFEAAGCGETFEAALITATGCGAHVQDFPHLFQTDPEWAGRARAFVSKLKDFSELASPLPATPPKRLRIALQKPCSLQHGLRLADGGAVALMAAGHETVEIPEAHICCGSAGSYSLLQPEIAQELRARKLGNIARVHADITVSGNIGCIDHLAGEGSVLHLAELLDWSEGGPVPQPLARFGPAR
jgi:glycolate oxidase iron-sulfur subunit